MPAFAGLRWSQPTKKVGIFRSDKSVSASEGTPITDIISNQRLLGNGMADRIHGVIMQGEEWTGGAETLCRNIRVTISG